MVEAAGIEPATSDPMEGITSWVFGKVR